MDSEVISIRVRKGSKKRLKKLGINTNEEIKAYLEALVSKAESKKTIDELVVLIKKNSKPSKRGFAVKSVREDRYENH